METLDYFIFIFIHLILFFCSYFVSGLNDANGEGERRKNAIFEMYKKWRTPTPLNEWIYLLTYKGFGLTITIQFQSNACICDVSQTKYRMRMGIGHGKTNE